MGSRSGILIFGFFVRKRGGGEIGLHRLMKTESMGGYSNRSIVNVSHLEGVWWGGHRKREVKMS